ncbi:uncharacterized protein BX664DRAFT_342754 [Halteromyces radiatus]|uniref:uncharacterized protein n=1 Tax=Halteromyces radiatus TaxID=101107 RepID=UPI002221256B|nr:uncharacterized protein BX664DRAFT_342754 [Halteromyces radiatus]KAI8078804.1 hypothetical protein BX664DRAFT_342754 [Halteromyces radiatus]
MLHIRKEFISSMRYYNLYYYVSILQATTSTITTVIVLFDTSTSIWSSNRVISLKKVIDLGSVVWFVIFNIQLDIYITVIV